ncbi:MAG: hypothetical protein ACTSVI_12310 [Promethearchaeota archaeon]
MINKHEDCGFFRNCTRESLEDLANNIIILIDDIILMQSVTGCE